MLRLKFSQVINIFIDDDPEIIGLLVRRHFTRREGLRHCEQELKCA